MRIAVLLISATFLPVIFFAQTSEPEQCPWGCPTFKMGTNVFLSIQAKVILDKVASKMKQYPDSNITIFNYPDTSSASKTLFLKKLAIIKNYLVTTKNIEADRINTISKAKAASRNNDVDIKTNYDFDAAKISSCPCSYPSIHFKGNAIMLTAEIRQLLDGSAARLKLYPECNITIDSYPEASKTSQALCNRRLYALKEYLNEKAGISADRITTDCIMGGGDPQTIDIKCN